MPSQPPLPPLLTPYVSSLPESSLTLISSVLAATGNWLSLRYLYAALGANPGSAAPGLEDVGNGKRRKVVLVSFLRGWDFWRSEAKKLVSYPSSMNQTVALAVISSDMHQLSKYAPWLMKIRALTLPGSQTRANLHSSMDSLSCSIPRQHLRHHQPRKPALFHLGQCSRCDRNLAQRDPRSQLPDQGAGVAMRVDVNPALPRDYAYPDMARPLLTDWKRISCPWSSS